MRKKQRHSATPRQPEVRHFAASGLEIRSASSSDEIVISGAPIVYNAAYGVRDMFGEFSETMSPGVANEALRNGADVRFLINHDGLPLARTLAGTLTLEDTPEALRFVARLDARQQLASDLAIAIERGDVSQMSCGFCVAADEWNEDYTERTIYRFSDLLDVSAVTYPASPTTSIEIAKRFAVSMSEAHRARIDKFAADVRAGKVLSQSNQDAITQAVTTLHSVLDSAGFDPSALIPSDERTEEEPPVDEVAEETAEDTTLVDEPIKEVSQRTAIELELEAELLKLKARH